MLGNTYDREICSAARALEIAGERWSLLILRNAAFAGMTRFSEFEKGLRIAPNILAARLERFVEEGLMTVALPLLDTPAPVVPLAHLDHLWFQVAGTLCNLTCSHCFISCSPHNHTFGFLDINTVRRALDESVRLGVKEYYFTGGEPFLNRDMVPILELTLRYGPATVLTRLPAAGSAAGIAVR